MDAVTTGTRKIEIVCTCGGSLPPWRIGFIVEVMGRSPVGAGCEMMRDESGQGTGYRLRCRRCGRSPEVTPHRWRILVAGLDTAGADSLDISWLPF